MSKKMDMKMESGVKDVTAPKKEFDNEAAKKIQDAILESLKGSYDPETLKKIQGHIESIDKVSKDNAESIGKLTEKVNSFEERVKTLEEASKAASSDVSFYKKLHPEKERIVRGFFVRTKGEEYFSFSEEDAMMVANTIEPGSTHTVYTAYVWAWTDGRLAEFPTVEELRRARELKLL